MTRYVQDPWTFVEDLDQVRFRCWLAQYVYVEIELPQQLLDVGQLALPIDFVYSLKAMLLAWSLYLDRNG